MPHLHASSSWSELDVESLQLPAAPFDQIHDDDQVDDDDDDDDDDDENYAEDGENDCLVGQSLFGSPLLSAAPFEDNDSG